MKGVERQGGSVLAPTGPEVRADLDLMLGGALAPYRGAFVIGGDQSGFVPGPHLCDPATMDRVIDRFGAVYLGANRRAIISLWSQCYFGVLVVPSVAVALLSGRRLALGLDNVCVRLDDDTARPTVFCVPREVDAGPASDVFERLRPLVREHVEPLISFLVRHGRVGPQLLWTNAATYVEWAVRTTEQTGADASVVRAGDRLLNAPVWPDGWRNPMAGAIRYVLESGARCRRRTRCCVRYLLPGVQGCGSLCPVRRVREALGP